MTFNTIEVSTDEGRPVFLYAFTLGATTWRFTSSDEDVVLGGYKWVATAISDSGLNSTGDANSDTLTITCPSDIAPVKLYIGTPPSQALSLAIRRYHEGDADSVLAYLGEVMQVDFPQPGTATFAVNALSVSLQRDGLRLGWQQSCPYALYDVGTCNVNKETYKVDIAITAVTPNTITVTATDEIADETLTGGFAEWSHPVRGMERRGIEKQVGSILTIFGLSDGLYYGLKLKAYPGCDRRPATCSGKFNNLDNYGGVPDMPGKSPFDGDPVF